MGNKDYFLNDITTRLDGEIDPFKFEACAADLLRADYPGITPLLGGKDAGIDGTLPSRSNNPDFLITTTSKAVLPNLKRNLDSYRKEYGGGATVILATNQQLSPQKVRNLRKTAGEMGFVLKNVHQRDYLASLLYESPKWARELLGITGEPPVLSKIPAGKRNFFDLPMIGRDDVYKQLADNSSDLIIVGQPGSGKTFLLGKFASQSEAFFFKRNSVGKLTEDFRRFKPKIVIVDDAHADSNLLRTIVDFRNESGFDFTIVASCWPGYEQGIKKALNIVENDKLVLKRLDADQIVDIVRAAGIGRPDWLVQEIVRQAEGKPGLAMTIVNALRRGGYEEVRTARLLLDHVSENLELTREVQITLAAFSLGGNGGISIQEACLATSLSKSQISNIVSKLADGGVVHSRGRNQVSVRPPALRHALLRDVFFNGAIPGGR